VKKVRGGKGDIQRTVDGHTQNDFIADLFANKYKNLYTSVRYDQTEMDGLRQNMADKVAAAGYDSNCIITFENIVNAASKLKPGKHDGHYGLSSDHVINACDELCIHIGLLLSALAVRGYITEDLSFSTILTIPKGKHVNYYDSANYRGIVLRSIIGKTYDLYVLSRYESLLTTSDLQFDFKIRHSTSMCTMILKETIDYYRTNCNDVYCTVTITASLPGRVVVWELIAERFFRDRLWRDN